MLNQEQSVCKGLIIFVTLLAGILPTMVAQAYNRTSVPVAAERYSDTVRFARSVIETALAKHEQVGGVSVALVSDSELVWSEGFGWASKIKKQPLTAATAMHMGSVSKLFTAIAVMQLVEQGKLDLDAPLQKYIPEFSIKAHNAHWPEFTLRQMLHHSSGLPANYGKGFYIDNPKSIKIDAYQQLPALAARIYGVNPPQRVHGYSNLAFSLLGLLIESVSGEYFPTYVNQHILDPLGTQHSSFLHDDRVNSRMAQGLDGGAEVGYEYIRDLAAGSLAATANDIASFMLALLNEGKGILSSSSLEEMFTQQNQATQQHDAAAPPMGLGFCLEIPGRLSGLRAAWHNGGIRSDYSIIVVLPDVKLGLAIMTSAPIGDTDEWVEDILARAYAAKTGHPLPALNRPTKRRLTNSEARRYAGYYVNSVNTGGGVWEIIAKGSSLKVKTHEDEVLQLIPYAGGIFEFSYKLFGFIPLNIEELAALRLIERASGSQYELSVGYLNAIVGGHFSPIKSVPIPEAWRRRIGKYRYDNATPKDIERAKKAGKSAEISLSWDDDREFLLLDDIPLRPLNDSQAVSMGIGRGRGETIEVTADRKLFSSGYILSRVSNAW